LVTNSVALAAAPNAGTAAEAAVNVLKRIKPPQKLSFYGGAATTAPENPRAVRNQDQGMDLSVYPIPLARELVAT
jgi:hypothetical protein